MDRRDLLYVFALGVAWGGIAVTVAVVTTVPSWGVAGITLAAVTSTVVLLRVRAELPPAPALRVRIPRPNVAREAVHPVPPDLRRKVKIPRAQRMTWRERRAWRKEHPVRISVPPIPTGAQ